MASTPKFPEAAKPRRATKKREPLRDIVEQLPDGVVIVGVDGLIRFANPAAAAMFGRPISDLLDQEFGFPVAREVVPEIEVVRPGGTVAAAELRVVDVEWEGQPASLVSLRDVTDRKRAEEQAQLLARERAARAEAEAANHAKSEFLAMMSHELRTPLNAVIGYTELIDLGIGGPVSDEQRQQLGRIRASGQHLLGLVNEVLDLAKVEAGRLSVASSPRRADLASDAAVAIVQPRAEEKGITISAECLLPSATYLGDEDRVRQILVNLLSNAVKFTPPGGRVWVECGMAMKADATTRLTDDGPWVYVRVGDTGPGIPKSHHAAIFEPFTQLSTGHTRREDGSGLGLTISRRLARLMKGDLTVNSEPGQGAVFTLWLPAVEGTTTPEPRAKPEWFDAIEEFPVPDDSSGTADGDGDGDGDGQGSARHDRRAKPRRRGEADQALLGVAAIGELLLREIDALLEAFVMRLRLEPLTPRAAGLRFSLLADHVASHLADVAGMLIAIEEMGGRPSALLDDSQAIQRLVSERHGSQRARLGWTEEALEREYDILREEVERMIRVRGAGVAPGAIEEALLIIHRFFMQGQEDAVRAVRRAGGAE